MTGETELAALLCNMTPQVQPDTFVFCTLSDCDIQILEIQPVGIFYEAEGVTVIVSKTMAISQGWPYTYECRQITLDIHSSLEAIGFLAVITTALAELGISVNPVSAYYHDHLFVPVDQAERAIACLQRLAVPGDKS